MPKQVLKLKIVKTQTSQVKQLEQFSQLLITLGRQIENFGEQMFMVVVDFLMSMECVHSIQENH